MSNEHQQDRGYGKRKTLQDYLLKNISELFLNLEDFLKIIVMTSFHMTNVSFKKKTHIKVLKYLLFVSN